jgi:hypothetical protein
MIDVVVDRAPHVNALKASLDGIRVDTLREILANKRSTVVRRSERKDLVDLYFLGVSGCDLFAAIPDAIAQDAGEEPVVVSMLLDKMHVEVPPLARPATTSRAAPPRILGGICLRQSVAKSAHVAFPSRSPSLRIGLGSRLSRLTEFPPESLSEMTS